MEVDLSDRELLWWWMWIWLWWFAAAAALENEHARGGRGLIFGKVWSHGRTGAGNCFQLLRASHPPRALPFRGRALCLSVTWASSQLAARELNLQLTEGAENA